METKTPTRAEALDAFLSEVNAIHINRLHRKGCNVEIDIMIANGKPLMVQTYWDNNYKTMTGWDIFIPANSENDVKKTLDAVRNYLKD